MQTNEFIRKVNRELGIESTQAPREFVTLPGTLPEACLLPDFKHFMDYYSRYGTRTVSDRDNLEMLTRTMAEGARLVDEFQEFADKHVGQDVIDAAEVTLRNLSRVEQSTIPLFAGLEMSVYGAARSACIAARALVGTILDQKALAGEL